MKVQTVPSRLTDRAVLNAKPQPSRYKISDDYGLYLFHSGAAAIEAGSVS
mgnify:CR=1 FL=1